jgi:membrane protein required for colicin V production
MNLLDVLILACMVFLIVRGIFRGFVREVGSLAGIILGIWAACVYHPQVNVFLKIFLPEWRYLPLVSVALVILLVLVVCNVAAWSLHKFITKVFLGWADRTMGAGLAILKGVVIVYFAIVLMTFFGPATSSIIVESKLAPAIVRSYQAMIGFFSPEAYDNLKKKSIEHKERTSTSPDKPKNDPEVQHGR